MLTWLALYEVSGLRSTMLGVSDTVFARVEDSLHKTAESGDSAERQDLEDFQNLQGLLC
jgi:hypothetical protein